MTLRRLWPLGLLALALASTGCSDGRKNPPDATVRVLNVVPSRPSLKYRRETETATNPSLTLGYQQGATNDLVYDEDTYNFHASAIDPATGGYTDVDNFSQKVVTGTLYTFVFVESGGDVTHTILESPRLVSNAANAQVQVLHGAEQSPTLDVYLEAPGTVITGATPWGTIGFKQSLASREVTAGVYELAVTEAGNPASVLFTTTAFTLDAGTSTTLVLSPDTGEGIAPLNVVLLNVLGATPLFDPSLPAHVRALNGTTDQAPRDVAFNSQFTPPLFSAAAFATPTAYQPLAAASAIPFNVTPAGNPGVLENSSTVDAFPAKAYTAFFTGDAGALVSTFQQDDRRRLTGQAKITFYDAAPVKTAVEVLFLAPGTDPATISIFSGLLVTPGSVQQASIFHGDHEIWLREYGTTTVVGGPVSVTLADKGLYSVVLSNDADGATIDMKLIDESP